MTTHTLKYVNHIVVIGTTCGIVITTQIFVVYNRYYLLSQVQIHV